MLDCSDRDNYTVGCGMLDNLNPFQSEEWTSTQVKWGKNETISISDVSTSGPTFIVKDYDKELTPLYKAIENKQWTKAWRILNDKSVSVEQVHTWMSRKTPGGDDRWKMLPLHAAILFEAPPEIVKLILQLSPDSASCKDDNDMVPLHLAFSNASSDEIIYELLMAYPMGTSLKDIHGRMPLQCGITSDPNSYRWKVIGTYTAMMKVQKKKEHSTANGNKIKLERVKKLYELEVEHLNIEYDTKINKCNSKLIECEKDILGKQETIDELKEKLQKEVADVAQLREELHQTDTKRKIAESDLQVAAEELVKLNEEKESLQQARDCYMLNEKQLQEKVTKLEQELFDWRNSSFASVKAWFDCS